MKAFNKIGSITVFLMFAIEAQSAIPTESFKSECAATVKVTEVSGAYYNKGAPPRGRFPGNPASANFLAQVVFQDWDQSCENLAEKYHLELFQKPLEVSVSVPPANLQVTEALAQAALDQVFAIEFKQDFQLASGSTLPLFPMIHGESLYFTGTLGETYNLGGYIAVDSLKVYGVPSLKQMTDDEKLNLAEFIVDYAFEKVKEPGWVVPYVSLLSVLEPESSELKVTYLNTLISLLEGLNPQRVGGPAFFEFYVGGSAGEPLAKQVNALAQKTGALSDETIESLAFQFPALLLIGHFGSDQNCFPVTEEHMTKVLALWQQNASELFYHQQRGAMYVASTIDGSGGVAGSGCLQKFKTNAVLAQQAKELKETLSNL